MARVLMASSFPWSGAPMPFPPSRIGHARHCNGCRFPGSNSLDLQASRVLLRRRRAQSTATRVPRAHRSCVAGAREIARAARGPRSRGYRPGRPPDVPRASEAGRGAHGQGEGHPRVGGRVGALRCSTGSRAPGARRTTRPQSIATRPGWDGSRRWCRSSWACSWRRARQTTRPPRRSARRRCSCRWPRSGSSRSAPRRWPRRCRSRSG